MDTDKLKKLRQFHKSLLSQQRILEDIEGGLVSYTSIFPLEDELQRLHEEFPSLVPPFDKSQYFSHYTSDFEEAIYNLDAIKGYVATAISRLEVDIEQPNDTPITEKREFAFINNSDLRAIIERDYSEIQRGYIAQCWKSVIILSGGAIEAILADLLIQNQDRASAAKSAPKNSDITHWDLSELIKVAVELSLVSAGVEKLSNPMREYRNLVHPGNELRNKLRFGAEEAKIALEVLNIVHRDLST